jgi:nitroimidazol reductase NimA-like FMN-containing flavoprotein (pyridoxamine 5'-phosphate oxidase superfamily)
MSSTEGIEPTAIDITSRMGVIDDDQCIELMSSTPIGRIAFTVDGHPMVVPVNFKWHDDTIVFRTLEGQKLDAAAEGQTVCFEIDHWDAGDQTGWSIAVIGKAREVTNFAEREQLESIGLIPWAKEKWRPVWVRIEPESIAGRVLR